MENHGEKMDSYTWQWEITRVDLQMFQHAQSFNFEINFEKDVREVVAHYIYCKFLNKKRVLVHVVAC